VVSGKYFCGDFPAVCTQVIRLAAAGTSSKGYAAEASEAAANRLNAADPAAPAKVRRKLLRDKPALHPMEEITAEPGLPVRPRVPQLSFADRIPAPHLLCVRCARRLWPDCSGPQGCRVEV
jgi:hypothetical protein